MCTGHQGGPTSQELQRSESNDIGDVAGAPDSPVIFSGLAVGVSRSWRVPEADLPWRTGHCPVHTGQFGEL